MRSPELEILGSRTRRLLIRAAAATLCTLACLGVTAGPGFAQGQARSQGDRYYVGQMTEEQIKQKLMGEGFSEVKELKKVPVTRYKWTGKAVRGGKEMEVTIDEVGHVSAK